MTSIALSVIIFGINIISSSAVAINKAIENEDVFTADAEKKQLCTATIDENFRDDSVLVMFNNETSLNLADFDKNDFSDINAKSVNDITKYSVNSIRAEHISRINNVSSISAEESATLIDLEQEFDDYNLDEDLKEKYSDFHQIVEIKLENTGKQEVLDAIHELEQRDDVLVAEPNYIIQLDSSTVVPNDTNFSEQWAIEKIDLPSAWSLTTGSSDVNVGIIDSGIKAAHSDLSDNIDSTLSKSFIDDSPLVDEYGHGTHVAGIVGAVGNNNRGITGACWDVNLISLKIFDSIGKGDAGYLAEAINYAQANNIEILNFSGSYGGSKKDLQYISVLQESINNYEGLFVCAAGNRRINVDTYPSGCDIYPAVFTNNNIVAVAATNQNDILWYVDSQKGSGYGVNNIDLAAPGQGICSTYIGETSDLYYANMTGTSMATPYVSGVAALIKSKYPGISTYGIKKALLDSVDKVSDLSDKVKTGGRLNAYKALIAVENCKYTVVYDKNGGTGSNMSNTTVTYGITTRLSPNTYTPPRSKQFIGWYAHRQSDNKWYYEGETGTGWYVEGNQPSGYTKHLYNDQARVAHTSSVNNDTVTMYAQWGPSNYIVSFDANGGGGITVASQKLTYDVNAILSRNTFSRSGYHFIGWTALRESDNKCYFTNESKSDWYVDGEQPEGYTKYIFDDQETVLNLSDVHNDTVYMYAQWEPNSYTIIFDSNGGTGSMNSITAYSDIDVNLGTNLFTKSGYLFTGWNIVDDDGYWCVVCDGYEDWTVEITEECSKKLFYNNDTVNYKSDNGCNLTAYAQWTSKDSVLIGDVNLDGNVNIVDVTTIQKYVVGSYTFNEVQLYAADVNGDGVVTVVDATELQEMIA